MLNDVFNWSTEDPTFGGGTGAGAATEEAEDWAVAGSEKTG